MNEAEQHPAEIAYALVCLRTGMVLGVAGQPAPSPRLVALAEAACHLFEAVPATPWAASFAQLGSETQTDAEECRRMVMISAGRVHVIERLIHRPYTALAAISSSGEALGNVLSGVRATLARLDVQ